MCSVLLGKDDEPVDGPQHYILLLGFYQPRLVKALDAVGVGVSSVIQLSSKHTQSEEQLEQQTPEGRREELSPGLDAGEGPSVFANLTI